MSKPSTKQKSSRGPGVETEKQGFITAILKLEEGSHVYQKVSFVSKPY
jgi:hypothetical protein